ncbi:Inositol polyphosphate 4-phosphatase type II [Manis javanica]|nr:Inositol polyphosphate 4-phosphatase type II [Manis javanica]
MSCRVLFGSSSVAPVRGNYLEALYQISVLYYDAQIIEAKRGILLGLLRDMPLFFTFLVPQSVKAQWDDRAGKCTIKPVGRHPGAAAALAVPDGGVWRTPATAF